MSDYKYMEKTLETINRLFISPDKDEITTRNVVLLGVVGAVVKELTETDSLFKTLYETIYYGGSFYDNLKVGKPDEFDLDLPFRLHKNMKFTLENTDEPGFVKVILNDLRDFYRYPELKKKYEGFEKLYNEDTRELDTIKLLKWMQGVVDKALGRFIKKGERLKTNTGSFIVRACQGSYSPAVTLKIVSEDNPSLKMDIDLVPCFVFEEEYWPQGFKEFRRGKFQIFKGDFFIVPKNPGIREKSQYWRLSFQKQERDLMHGKERLKPALKLLKKLRDRQGHDQIKSYFLKSLTLLEIEKQSVDWNKKPLSHMFMMLLKSYCDHLEEKCIPYFWYEEFNLLAKINPGTLRQHCDRIRRIIKKIDADPGDEDAIVNFFLTEEELWTYRSSRSHSLSDSSTSSDEENRIVARRSFSDYTTSYPIRTNNDNELSTAQAVGIGVGVAAAAAATAIGLFAYFRNRDRNN